MRAPALGVLVLTAALGLAGCQASAPAASHPVETNRVTMAKSYRFDPPVIAVPVGTTVTWHNDDNFTDDVHLLGERA